MFDQVQRPRVRAFVGPNAEEKAQRVGMWLKAMAGQEAAKRWCVQHGVALVKAQAEGVDSAGGFLAPEDFESAIAVVREAVGAFRQGAQVLPMRSVDQVRPRRIGGLTAAFVDEGAAIPESSFQLDAIGATARKLAILARASNELFEDSAPDLAEFVADEIGYAFAGVEDDCGFNGDGSSAYKGITGLGAKLVGMASSVPAAAGHNTFAAIDAADIGKVMGGVLAAAIPGAAWYCSSTAYALTFCRLAATSGGLVASQRADGTIAASYVGFPVRFSAKLPDVQTALTGKPMLFFGNLAMSSCIAERRGLVIATSLDRALEYDQVLLRGVQRCDIINHTCGSATERGPVAALIGTA